MTHPVQEAYGLEVAAGLATVVRLRRQRGAWQADVLARRMPVSDAASWRPIAEDLTRRQAAATAGLAAAAPVAETFMRQIEAPFASVTKALAVFPSLLDVQLPFPLEQCTCRFTQVAPRPDGSVGAVAVAMPHERMERTLEAWRSVGVDPDWVDHEGLVLWQAARREGLADNTGVGLVFYLADDRIVLVAGNALGPLAAFSARIVWAESDETAREKARARIRTFLAGALPRDLAAGLDVLVAGPGAAEAESWRVSLELATTRWRVADQPDVFLARALAEHRARRGAWGINLRDAAHEHPVVHIQRERRQRRAVLQIATAAALVVATSVAGVLAARARHDHWQRAVQAEARAITGATAPRGQELFFARQAFEAMDQQAGMFRDWLAPSPTAALPELLAAARQRGVTLERLRLASDVIEMNGAGRDWADAEALTAPMVQRGWKINIERKDAGPDELVHFTVRGAP